MVSNNFAFLDLTFTHVPVNFKLVWTLADREVGGFKPSTIELETCILIDRRYKGLNPPPLKCKFVWTSADREV